MWNFIPCSEMRKNRAKRLKDSRKLVKNFQRIITAKYIGQTIILDSTIRNFVELRIVKFVANTYLLLLIFLLQLLLIPNPIDDRES